MFVHWNHEHPLAPVDIQRSIRVCDGCLKPFGRGEKCYGCSQECGYDVLLHEECAEAPRKITHAMHPQHTLTQQYSPVEWQTRCSVCQGYVACISYGCTSVECMFVMHISCAGGSDMMYEAEDGEGSIIHHASHPKHKLELLRRRCSFKCDACGTTHAIGSSCSSYTCTDDACEYWIHERCASLPHTIQREDHNHSLSLTFHVPLQYLVYNYRCDVCSKRLISKFWIYHCELCSYAVHITCAFTKSLPDSKYNPYLKSDS